MSLLIEIKQLFFFPDVLIFELLPAGVLEDTCCWSQTGLLCCSSSADAGRRLINGVNVHYEKTGRGGHPVLLCPGALGQCGAGRLFLVRLRAP